MEPTALDHLIAFLLSARSTRVYRNIIWSRVKARHKRMNVAAFRQQLYRLHQKGLIETQDEFIHICREDLFKFSLKRNTIIKDILPKKTEKIIISFDIPETKKKTRDWLRNQIKFWNFEMIHKSLWLGNGPLPEEFMNRLKNLGIDGYVKIFKVKKST